MEFNALMTASQNEYDKVVDILIKAGADINYVKQDGYETFMITSEYEHEKLVAILNKAGADILHVENNIQNALIIASQNGDDKLVNILIKAGADINFVKQDGYNALMIASLNGHDKVIDILIEAGADINHVEDDGFNALMIASRNGHDNVVDHLIKAGADIHHVNDKLWNALMFASHYGNDKVVEILIKAGSDIHQLQQNKYNALMIASQNGHDKVVDILIKAGADINHVEDDGWNALLVASQNGHDKVVEILIKAGADINYVKQDGYNALMIASQNGHDKVVDILIKAGADVNHVKDDGWNALMIASYNGHDKVVDILIKAGTDKNHVEYVGKNALMISSLNGHDKVVDILIKAEADIHHVEENGSNALMLASQNGHEKVVDILIKAGADINFVKENGWNALLIASQNGHEKVVDILIKTGADIHHVKENGWNALMIASQSGHEKVVDILINAGADINHVEDATRNALMIASLNGHDKVVDILIKAGADINHVGDNGWNALLIALQKEHDTVVDILIKCGADINHLKDNGWNALMIASQNGHDKVVDTLIKAGADINHLKDNGWNALMIASQNGHNKVVDILIKCGADIHIVEEDGCNALMIASKKGHEKVVNILIKAGADISHVKQNGNNALLIASNHGHDKVVDSLINEGADIIYVNEIAQDSSFLGDRKNDNKDCLKTFSFRTTLLLELIDVCFLAFESKQKHVIDTLSSMNFKIIGKTTSTTMFHFLISLFEKALKQDLQNDTKNELSDSTVSEQNDAEVRHVKRSIDCYVKTVLLSHNNQKPSYDVLHDFVADVMLEFSNMRNFDALHFFMCQRCLKTIYSALNAEDTLRFFTTLLDRNYTDITARCLKDENLLDTTAPGFSLSLIRDVLSLLISGSHHSTDFALRLAEIDVIKICTDFLITHKDEQKSQSKWIIIQVFSTLHNIARRKEVMRYFTFNNTFKAIANMDIKGEDTLTVATVLLLDLAYDSTTYTDAISVLNDYAKRIIGVNVREINGTDFQTFKKSIRCCATITVLTKNNQTPSREELREFVSDVMSEFSNMRVFDALHFFMYQRCLNIISSAVNECDRLTFFSLLLQHNYADCTIKSFEEKILLNTTAAGFEMSLIRDVLFLLLAGSGCSSEFALKLAELNVVKLFTDFLISSKNVQNTPFRFISKRVICILLNIARREGGKKYFTSNKTAEAILNMKFRDIETSFLSKLLVLLTEDGSIVEKEEIRKVKRSVKQRLIPALRGEDQVLSDWPLSVLLQGLSKFTERDEYLNEMLPLVPRLKEILSHEDIEENIFTTQCFKELSRFPEASEQIIRDETLSDLLNKSLSRGHKDISANVHSIRWRSGRATGMLPSKADFVVSEEFPKEFKIEPSSLALGGFGSIHLVYDINGPKDVKFVTKKMFQKLNDSRKYMESFQKEASILIRLKHERIVQFHGFQKTENELLLFMEFVKMGTLSAFIKQHTKLNEDVTRKFTIQILEGVKYLHGNKVLHLDIKGNNILMADEANIKLTDFGLSTILNEEEGVEAERGTTRYMAPEMINCPDGRIFKHASSLDIWSVGCTVVEMITGSPPNATTTSVQVLFKMAMLQKPKYELPETASEYLKEFLEKTFKEKAAERPSAETLLSEDPFVAGKMLKLNQKNTI